MLPGTSRSGRSRLRLAALIGVGAVGATALVVAVAATGGAGGAPSSVALAPAAAQSTTAELDGIDVPAAPSTCSQRQLDERAEQLRLLDAEVAAEQRVIDTVTDGSLQDKLGAIRDGAGIILGRIEQIDGRCPVERPGVPGDQADDAAEDQADEAGEDAGEDAGATEDPAPAPADGADRALAALDITCAEPDLTGIDAVAADRARTELATNEAQLDGRLAAELPRFAGRVAREADPEPARAEFAGLAEDLANTLEDRRLAILQRAGVADAAADAETCEVAPATD